MYHIDQLEGLRELEVELAIDDFDSGNSSPVYLKLLPIRRLKLDRAILLPQLLPPAKATAFLMNS